MNNSNDDSSLSFVTREDPTHAATAGEKLRFEYVKPHFDVTPRFADVANWQVFQGILLAVVSSDESDHSILGSAIMVAPGVALSASHSLKERLPELRRGGLSMMCIGLASTGAQAWNVKLVTFVETTDMCILSLEYALDFPSTRTFYQAALTTRVPAIGEKLIMAGFRGASESFETRYDRTADLWATLYLSSGVVTQQYLRTRDRVKIPWPTLEVDCPTIGGMSGGPVFDARGFLVGLVTSSFDCGPGIESTPTYSALLWPVFGKQFEGGWPGALFGDERKTLLDLNDRGICQIEQSSAVRLSVEDGKLTITFSPWS
jgi:hypothetical protein